MKSTKFTFAFNLFTVSVLVALAVIILINAISLSVTNAHFSFQSIGQLHAANPQIWFLYIIIGGFLWLAYYLESCRSKKIKIQDYKASALNFAKELEKGNLEATYPHKDNDKLAKVLVNLRDRLKKNKEDEIKRQKEDEQRNWVSNGIAKFSDILRSDKDNDLKEIAFDIISNLVKYMDANQGGLFIINEEEPDENESEEQSEKYFELAAAYAFNRRKYHQKRIEWGVGLLGTCALEKEPIYMTDIPDEYINITSGLGDANPRSLLLVPLKIEEEVYGVIEIASFKEMEEYERNFVERIGENVASTISTIKTNNRTNELLRRSQQQAEELSSQEEELRQNIEEMKATQESLEESQAKTDMIFKNAIDAIIAIDEQGIIDQFSPSAEQLFGYTANEVIGENVKILMPESYANQHDQYLKRYRETGEKHIIGKTREETAITREEKEFPIELRVEEAWLGDKKMFIGFLRDITEKKNAEEERRQYLEEMKATQESLQETQAKTKMIFDNAMDAIITINEQGTIDQFSPSAEKLFGYSAEEVKGENVKILMPETYSKHHDQYLKRYRETGEKHIIGKAREEKGMTKDGEEFPIELRVEEAWLGDERMFVGMIRDITEKKKAEEELNQQMEEIRAQEEELRQNIEEMKATQESLEESQAKTKMIFENAMDAIITIDEQGTVDQFSPSAENLFGYSADEVVGENIKMLMPKEYAVEHDQYLQKYKETGEKHIIGKAREEKGKTKDGTIFPIEIRVEEAWLGDKKMFVGMLRDVTERKQAEEELKQQMEEVRSQDEELRQNMEELQTTQEMIEEREAKVRMIFENAMDAIITIDEQGKIDQFSPSAEQLFGYSADEVIGESINILMPQEYAEKHDEYINRYLQTGEKHIIGQSHEKEGKRKDGSTFPVEIRVEEAWLGDKRMFVGVLRDITEKKKHEEELHQQVEELQTQDEMMKQNLKELKKTQKSLEEKDKEQQKEIEKLNAENEKKIRELKQIDKEQHKKDEETKRLYEKEINEMFETWNSHLEAIDNKIKKN